MKKNDYLKLKQLNITIDNSVFLKNISLSLKTGDILAILGPNGAGKSSLLKGIMSHFNYPIKSGLLKLNDEDITSFSTDKKANLGFFYYSQNPVELEGVQMLEFFKHISKNSAKNFYEFYKQLNSVMNEVDLDHEFLKKSVNVGFSGGEKKRNEILQAKILKPKIMLIDEIDSGLDLDAIKMVQKYINEVKNNSIILIVSHHIDFLKKINPNKNIVLIDGQIVKKDEKNILNLIKKEGYKKFYKNVKSSSQQRLMACCNNYENK